MRTSPSRSGSLSAVAAALLFIGSSASALAADEKAAPAGEPAAVPAPPPAAPAPAESAPAVVAAPVVPTVSTPVVTTPAPAAEATKTAGALAVPPKSAEEAPLVTEIGIQRLPGSAYPEPQTRGLKYGSLWLTFHGLQWPYMPATTSGKSRFVIGLSGWGWVDTSYEKFRPWGDNPQIETSRIAYWKQQSRMLARVTPTYSFDDYFIQGQVELVGTGDQTIQRQDIGGADTDDLYLRFGQWNKWDVQVGRFEGWEVFHLGMGLDQNTFERTGAVGPGDTTNISYYGLTDNQFRPQGAAGNFAVHYYPLSFLRFELLGMAGSFSGPAYATRPVAILDFGWLKFKVGTEYQKIIGQNLSDQTATTSKGVGGAIQFVFEPHIEFGLNAAQGTVVSVDNKGSSNDKGSYTRTSLGGFATVSNGSARHPVLVGIGAMFTRTEDQYNPNVDGINDNIWLYQSYAAVQYVMWNQLYIKAVAGYSRSHFRTPTNTYEDENISARLRFAYYF